MKQQFYMFSDKQIQELGDAFGKSKLEGGLYGFVKRFYLLHSFDIEKILPGNAKAKFAVERFKEKKQLNKTDLYTVCFSVFENEEIYTHFRSTLSIYIQKLIEILLWQEVINHADAEKELDVKLLDAEKSRYSGPELKREFYFFSVGYQTQWTTTGQRNNYFLSIPKPLRDILVQYYAKPAYYYFLPINEIPAGFNVFNAETQIMLEMPAILSYHLQASVKYTNSGRPNEASVNKMQRSCNLTEFYQEDLLKNIRSMLIAGMLHNLKIKDINTGNSELIKTIFTEHYKTIYTPQFMLTQFKGWAYINEYYFKDASFEPMLDVLKQLPQNKWVTAENLHGFISSRTLEIKGVENSVVNSQLKFNENFIGTNTDSGMVSLDKLVKIPYINGCVFLLASFGLVEIVYGSINTNKYGTTYFSPFDGLKFLRLTPLGAYALGITDEYESQYVNPQNKLHLSEDSMVILAEGNIAVIDVMLANYTEKEGSNRYRVTSAAFFKDCKNTNNIDTKINLFKKTISSKLPRYWEATFNEWKANAKKVKEDLSTVVFKIPADAKDLQNLIAKDAVLKAFIFKAEGFHVLVAKDNETKFKHRMKELGYYVD